MDKYESKLLIELLKSLNQGDSSESVSRIWIAKNQIKKLKANGIVIKDLYE